MERDITAGALPAPTPEDTQSAVSWGAVFAGAVAALALSFVLLALAGGFGLKVASAWPGGHSNADGFSPIVGSSLIVVQVLAAALGGYLAGRLRTRWTHVHGHEVHFRDTAHGFLAWAVSTVAGVVLATAVMAPAASQASAAAVTVAIQAAMPTAAGAPPAPDPATVRLNTERATNVAAQMSLFMGIGLLLSAFIASVAAAIGGLRRDDMHVHYWTEHARAGHPLPTGR